MKNQVPAIHQSAVERYLKIFSYCLLVSVVIVLFGGLFCLYNIQHNATQSLIWRFHITHVLHIA